MIDLGVDAIKPAVVAIDCHRGHLDPDVATMPAPADVATKLVANNKAFTESCRALNIPIVHLVTAYRDVEEIRSNPRWRALADDPNSTRKNVEKHNLIGSPGLEIMPGLCDTSSDMIVNVKKRYDCFQDTDLDFVLRKHGVNTLLVTGINTNSCQEKFAWHHDWKEGDLVVWDNWSTLHHRNPFNASKRRIMHRTQIKGLKPQ
jgi:nicotinamidase-related amidase